MILSEANDSLTSAIVCHTMRRAVSGPWVGVGGWEDETGGGVAIPGGGAKWGEELTCNPTPHGRCRVT